MKFGPESEPLGNRVDVHHLGRDVEGIAFRILDDNLLKVAAIDKASHDAAIVPLKLKPV
jgi:hypothetical protein